MKHIEYMGYRYTVPDWVNYVGADKSGAIYAYETMPVWDRHMYLPDSNCKFQQIGQMEDIPPLTEV